MNILIVENTKLYQTILTEMFSKAGAVPTLARDAREALGVAAERTFDLVCASRQLPDLSGPQLLTRIRRNAAYANVPAILLTADDSDSSRREGFDAGFTDILNKANVENIGNSIQRLVQRFQHQLHGKVLYLEDSPSVAAVTRSLMENMGLLVDHFTSAEEGLKVFADIEYDLVVTDVVLEGAMTGVGVVNAIRSAEGDRSRTPILVVSGADDVGRRVELLRLGANDCVTKPLQEEEFSARITNLVHYKQLFDQVRAQQKQLQEMATTDQLTGLFNRHSLSEFGPKYVSEGYRHQYPVCMLVVDLDHFKSVNDNHGHSTGDEVLSAIGALLKQKCRNEDMAARFGGEEFVMILSHCDLEDGERKAEQVREQVEVLKPAGLTVTASIGVAALPAGAEIAFEDLFNGADKAVYEAKHGGRNQVRIHTFEE